MSLVTSGLNRLNSEVGKTLKSEVYHSSPDPSDALLWMGQVEDGQMFCDLSIICRNTSARLRGSCLQNRKRTQEMPKGELLKASCHSRKKGSVDEAITHGQTTCSNDLRVLQNRWRQGSHFGREISKVQKKNGSLQAFDTKWDEVLSAVTGSFCQLIRESALDASRSRKSVRVCHASLKRQPSATGNTTGTGST